MFHVLSSSRLSELAIKDGRRIQDQDINGTTKNKYTDPEWSRQENPSQLSWKSWNITLP